MRKATFLESSETKDGGWMLKVKYDDGETMYTKFTEFYKMRAYVDINFPELMKIGE